MTETMTLTYLKIIEKNKRRKNKFYEARKISHIIASILIAIETAK